ncbi:uncharacterized protein LOC121284201 isoform X2 [Carcharodon carcharias]|nr:uncharacterized protein LOC121284201 isoform X2 [Carcharodon carcharias]
MKLLGYIYILSSWIKCAHPEPALVQTPREVLATEGDKIELTCSLKGASLEDVFWYKFNHSSTGHFLKSANVLDKQVNGVGMTDRFTVNRDTFRLQFRLTIKDLTLSDKGTYICLITKSQAAYTGDGSVVTVVPARQQVTSPPPTAKGRTIYRDQYPNTRRKKKADSNGYVCSWTIWGSLIACNLLLLISIVSIVIHRRKKSKIPRRRCPHQFRKR